MKNQKTFFLRKLFGTIFLISAIICLTLWVFGMRDFFIDFNSPLLFAYFNYSLKSILIPIYYLKEKIKEMLKDKESIQNLVLHKKSHEFDLQFLNEETFSEAIEKVNKERSFDYDKNFCKITATVFFLYFIPTLLYIWGFNLTNKRSNYILSNLGTIFIAIIMRFYKKKQFSIQIIIAIIIFYSGVILFTISINETDQDNLFGDMLIFLAVIIFSIYIIKLKSFSKYYPSFDITQVFGYIGINVMILVPFVLIFLQIFKDESIKFPVGKDILIILLDSIYSCANDIFVGLAIILLSPYLIAAGMSLYYPIMVTNEIISNNTKFDVFYLIGIILVISAFGIFLKDNCKSKQKIEKYNIIK